MPTTAELERLILPLLLSSKGPNKILAIKTVRDHTTWGLSQSKNFVDSVWEQIKTAKQILNEIDPEIAPEEVRRMQAEAQEGMESAKERVARKQMVKEEIRKFEQDSHIRFLETTMLHLSRKIDIGLDATEDTFRSAIALIYDQQRRGAKWGAESLADLLAAIYKAVKED